MIKIKRKIRRKIFSTTGIMFLCATCTGYLQGRFATIADENWYNCCVLTDVIALFFFFLRYLHLVHVSRKEYELDTKTNIVKVKDKEKKFDRIIFEQNLSQYILVVGDLKFKKGRKTVCHLRDVSEYQIRDIQKAYEAKRK